MDNSGEISVEKMCVTLPSEVTHFVHTLCTGYQHGFPQAKTEEPQGVSSLVHRKWPPLFLLRCLNYLKTEEGSAWISTLPIDALARASAFTGVPTSLARVLAIGVIVQTLITEHA